MVHCYCSFLKVLKVLFSVSSAKKERMAEGKEKKEGATKWSQGTSDRVCPLSERTSRAYASPVPRLTVSRNHKETWSRVDTISPK